MGYGAVGPGAGLGAHASVTNTRGASMAEIGSPRVRRHLQRQTSWRAQAASQIDTRALAPASKGVEFNRGMFAGARRPAVPSQMDRASHLCQSQLAVRRWVAFQARQRAFPIL